MAYDGKLLARARMKLDDIRRDNQQEQLRRLNTVYARLPRIRDIDLQLRGHMARIVALTVGRSPQIKEEMEMLKEQNLSLQMERAELLVENGFGSDYLDEIISCEKCRDSGTYQGGVCSCLDRLYNMELTKELGTLMRRGDESFEKFDLSLYPAEYDPVSGVVPRQTMQGVYEFCRRYSENFAQATKNLLFQGGTGLGKTYLSACIARTVSKQGFSVCYETAAAALDCYERAKFSRDAAEGEEAAVRVKRMEDCDLMILDDLGTEMVTPMSQSALYTLVNKRLVNGKKTVISTNCRDEELQRKYTPQICSRIAGEFMALPFVGRDIRLLKKGG